MLNRRNFTKLLAFSAPVLGSKFAGAPEVHPLKPSYLCEISDKIDEGPYVAGEDIKAGSFVVLRDRKLYRCRRSQPHGIVESESPCGSGVWMVTKGCVNVRVV